MAKPRPRPTTTASPVTNPVIVPVHKQSPGQIAMLTVLAIACIVILLLGAMIVCRGMFKCNECDRSLSNEAGKITNQLKGLIKRELLVATYTSRMRRILPNSPNIILLRNARNRTSNAQSEELTESTIENGGGVHAPETESEASRHM